MSIDIPFFRVESAEKREKKNRIIRAKGGARARG